VESCGLLDKIEELQHHPNQKIFEKVQFILKTYFQNEEENDQLPLVGGSVESSTHSGGPTY
jgi:hypothetical protein